MVLVRRKIKVSALIGYKSIATEFQKVDFSTKFLSFCYIFSLTTISNFLLSVEPILFTRSLIKEGSQNWVLDQLLNRWTQKIFPVRSLDRSTMPIQPSQRQDSFLSQTISFFSSSESVWMKLASIMTWNYVWNMWSSPWQFMATPSIMQQSSILDYSLVLYLSEYLSASFSSCSIGVVQRATQVILERRQGLWFFSRNFQLNLETAQQFIKFSYCQANSSGSPRMLPMSVMKISKKLPRHLTPRRQTYKVFGKSRFIIDLLMKK